MSRKIQTPLPTLPKASIQFPSQRQYSISMEAELTKLVKQIDFIEQKLCTLPEGKIFCCSEGRNFKWFHSVEKKQTYIKRSNRPLAEQLALKKYLLLLLEESKSEKYAIELYLRHHPTDSKSYKMLTDTSAYPELLSPYFTPLSTFLSDWATAPYPKSEKHPEQLIHKTSFGLIVRSKSEELIASLLHIHQIPFRYECALNLGGVIYYPDFTIRHPITGKVKYWEHFGLMDDSKYARKSFSKLEYFNSFGITPSISLITTFETEKHPLTADVIEKMIEENFLS